MFRKIIAIHSENQIYGPYAELSIIKECCTYKYHFASKNIGVGVARSVQWLGYGLDDRGSIHGRGSDFSLPHRVQTGSGAHPASYPMGTWDSFPGGKVAGAWNWPFHLYVVPSERMRGAIPPLSQYVFMAWCLVNHRDNSTFILNLCASKC
jgi:hypothetical protein